MDGNARFYDDIIPFSFSLFFQSEFNNSNEVSLSLVFFVFYFASAFCLHVRVCFYLMIITSKKKSELFFFFIKTMQEGTTKIVFIHYMYR